MSGSGGSASQGGSTAGMATGGVTTAGTATGGVATGGVATAGTATGGVTTAGAAGSNGGAGGSAAGASGSGGGSGVTFTQVKELMAMSCKGAKCHDPGNAGKQVDLITSDGLYTRLTTPLPAATAHCVGDTLIVPSMPTTSLLVKAITGPDKISCSKAGGGTEMIARMPDDCPTQRMCLTEAQIKLISDWVAAGAKM